MLYIWKLKKIRLKEEKRLNNTNLHLYKSINKYIHNSQLKPLEKEEILQQIMDMMLQAQIENTSISLIIGKDYKKFCESIILESNLDKGKISIIFDFIKRYLMYTTILLISMAAFNNITSPFYNFTIDINNFLIANVISIIIIPASKKERQKTSFISSFKERLYMINQGLGNNTSCTCSMIFILIFSILLNENILNLNLLNYKLSLAPSIPYIGLIFILISTIKILKVFYSKG
ncbi:DUF1048 domain-containing protein [Clostridium rectalis]|uniref:DUF1048 domain-containing protein n=1 Tax=Clostridium rectalis TaxID=2040295 RepID=UPI000F63FB8B|nr:DUF1048 domain-containing protein [Clostridium rectalis]